MSIAKRYKWFVSPKWCIELIGGEFDLLYNSGSRCLLRYYIAAITIVFILLVSIVSIFYAMRLLFHMQHVEVLLALFLSTLFVFIYVFLLNTFSKNIFSERKTTIAGLQSMFRFSNVIRTGFVIFMGFIISKPIELFFFKHYLDNKTAVNKSIILDQYKASITSLNISELEQIGNSIFYYTKQNQDFPSDVTKSIINKLVSDRTKLVVEQNEYLRLARIRLQRSDFFLYRVKVVSRKWQAWLVCIVVVALFLLPGFLIYSIPHSDEYFKQKKERDQTLIKTEFQLFTQRYHDIFRDRFNLSIDFYTKYDDPPFNTKLKKGPNYQSQSDFLKQFT